MTKTHSLPSERSDVNWFDPFSELNLPSTSPLTSPDVQQLHCHCSLPPPALGPDKEEVKSQYVDERFKANKQMKRSEVRSLPQERWQSSAGYKYRRARRPL